MNHMSLGLSSPDLVKRRQCPFVGKTGQLWRCSGNVNENFERCGHDAGTRRPRCRPSELDFPQFSSAHNREVLPRLVWMDFTSGCCQRSAQADRSAANSSSSPAIARRRFLSLIFDTEPSTVMSLTAAVLSRASSSMGFPILAIDETFMDCCWSFETSLMKRSN
jgi:hypothetical protein